MTIAGARGGHLCSGNIRSDYSTPPPLLKCSSSPCMVENPSHLELNPCVIACAVRISSRSSVPGAWWMVSDRNVHDHEDDLLDFYLQMFIPLSSSLESIQTPWKCSVKVIFCSTMLQNVSSTFEDQHQYGGSPEWRGGTHPSPNLSVNDLWSYGWRNLCK